MFDVLKELKRTSWSTRSSDLVRIHLTGAVNVISAKAEIGGDLGGSISLAGEDQNSAANHGR